jgi:predicted extracellular nuclease/2',3'-cyclic-nucleotide 2'-phosphodiesterase (5'-nucleotidase family)
VSKISLSVVTILAMVATLIPATVASAAGDGITINEIRIDQPGADNDEYFELSGPADASLEGLTYLVIGDGTGGSGVVEASVDLSGNILDGDGLFLVAEGTLTLGAADLVTDLNFENSDNVTHLLVEGFTGGVGDDLDTNDDGILDANPWSAELDRIALILQDNPPTSTEYHYGPPTVGPDGNFVPGHVYDCADPDNWPIGPFDPAVGVDTPGAANDCSDDPPPPHDPVVLTISEIQGPGHISPHVGVLAQTTGIVTATSGNGFYLQDPFGDDDIATADAIFVFTNSAPTVAVGDGVTVVGTVSEFTPGGAATRNLSTTQISVTGVVVDTSGNALPDPELIGSGGRIPPTEVIEDDAFGSFDPEDDGLDFFESVEAMRVTVKSPTVVGATSGFGEIFTVPKGVEATSLSQRGTLNISPEDYNPERVQIDPDSAIFDIAAPMADTGAVLSDVTGVVGYNFGNFEVIPTETFEVSGDSKLRPETTSLRPRGNKLTMATYNVLNLDPNDADGDTDVADGRFDAVAAHIADNLRGSDIVALQEVQDNDGGVDSDVTAADQTLQMLVDAIEAQGGPSYEFIDNPFIGNDTSGGQPGANIRVAYLYNPDRVTPVGSPDTVVDPADQQANDTNPFWDTRLPLVQTFRFKGKDFTVVNNHLASKTGSAPLYGTEQNSTERQEDPTVNGDVDLRRAQAQAVRAYIDSHLAFGENVVVLGDFNEFEFISPLAEDLSDGLENLTLRLKEHERYSYVFDGNSQSLDHILVSENMSWASSFDAVHVNAEFAATAARGSDHDPLVVSIDAAKVRSGLSGPGKGEYRLFVLHNNDGESDLLPADDGAGSISRFGELLIDEKRELEKGRREGAIALTAGDNFLASPEFTASLEKGVPFYDSIALDYLPYDLFTIGNHEFDFGPETLADFINGIRHCDRTPFLSANLVFDAEPSLAELVEEDCIVPSTVLSEDGRRIGVIGLTTPELREVSSPGDVEIFTDLAAIANAEAAEMTAAGIDIIIVASHLQNLDNEVALAAELSNVDAIVGGGGGEALRTARTAVNADGVTIPIVTVPGDYFDVGKLMLEFDDDGNLTDFAWRLLPVTGDLEQNRFLLNRVETPVTEFVADLAAEVVADSGVGLNGVRGDVRTRETNVGNLLSDSFVMTAQARADEFGVTLDGPIVGLQNGGGIRNDSVIGPGPITVLDTFDIAPFSNFVAVVVDVSPEDLVAAVEHGLAGLPGEAGSFGQWSGLVVRYDPAAAAGSRVVDLSVNAVPYVVGGVLQSGLAPVDLATIDFLAQGNDGYDMFEAYDFTTVGTSYQQSLRDIIEIADLSATSVEYRERADIAFRTRIIPIS